MSAILAYPTASYNIPLASRWRCCHATSHKSSRCVPRGSSWAHGLVGDYCQSPRCLPIDTSCTTPATLPRNSTGCQPPTRLTITKPKNNSTSQINKSKMSLWKHTSFYQKKTVKAMQRFNLSSAVKEPKMAHQDQRAPPDSPDLNDKIWASTTWQRWDPDRHELRNLFLASLGFGIGAWESKESYNVPDIVNCGLLKCGLKFRSMQTNVRWIHGVFLNLFLILQ